MDVHGHSDNGLKRVLTVKDLTLMGVAAVIGGGIFTTIGSAAYNGGPGVIFLFMITAVTCGFTALCYAEFASRIPVAGSAYTYSYVSFGEVVADQFLAQADSLEQLAAVVAGQHRNAHL